MQDSTAHSSDSSALFTIEEIKENDPFPAPSELDEVFVDILRLDTSIIINMKYATSDNLIGKAMYECGRCYLHPRAAEALSLAQQLALKRGYRLMVYDCYRPLSVQQIMWEKYQDPTYVADPEKGSMHNRGKAVDITLTTMEGQPLNMGTLYDHFGKKANPSYTHLPQKVLDNRQLLRKIMLEAGFQPIRSEWWHFSLPDFKAPKLDLKWRCQ